MFSNAKLSVAQAERRLADAQQVSSHSEKLFAKGFITEAQLQQDRFDLEQAQQELKLANTERRQQKIAAEMDILNAKQNLTEAKQRLEYTQQLTGKGFASQRQLQRAQTDVDLAERVLKNAQLKLEATEQIEAIKQNDQ